MTEERSGRCVFRRAFFAFFWGLLALGTTERSFAAKGAFALYQFTDSHDSKCLPNVSNPDSVLSKNGIRVIGASSSGERQSLANGIAKVQHLLGGRTFPSSWRVGYLYVNSPNSQGKFTWNQGLSRANFVTVRRPSGSTNGQNETRLMHELGHKIGGAGNYGKYNSSVRKCNITPYCSSHVRGRNEEFAEAFAAFVTRPASLKSVCPDAYNFFSKQVFPGSNAVADCGQSMDGEEAMLLASAETNSGGAGYVRNRCTKNLFCWLFKIGCPPCAESDDTASGTNGAGGAGGTTRGSNHGGQR
ncbi:MAG TPA: hypothetical protein PL182_03345 [Pseudobdellovibrionaceae bacterium]|nr:hypothetical protein [Pseudobdellovibrionaceae bacterium]